MRKGYITVYLSLVTGILLSLLLTVIEGVRMHTIRTQTECVMDMAMDSALAEYHREMLEQYELFFIDMSYGGTSPAFSNTEEHIRNYMNMNFRPYELFDIPVGKDQLSTPKNIFFQMCPPSGSCEGTEPLCSLG